MREAALRPLEGIGERAYRVLADEDIALRGEVGSRHAAGPGEAIRAGIARRAPLRIHGPYLPLLRAIIRASQRGDGLLRRLPRRQQVESARAIAGVGPRLRRHRAH